MRPARRIGHRLRASTSGQLAASEHHASGRSDHVETVVVGESTAIGSLTRQLPTRWTPWPQENHSAVTGDRRNTPSDPTGSTMTSTPEESESSA